MIVLIFVCIMIIIIIGLIYGYYVMNNCHSPLTQSSIEDQQINQTIYTSLRNEAYLHRFLMIEIINNKANVVTEQDSIPIEIPLNPLNTILSSNETISEIDTRIQSEKSDSITYNKILESTTILSKCLTQIFGSSISHMTISIIHNRNKVIRDYYYLIINNYSQIESIEIITYRKLGALTREMVSNIANNFEVIDSDQTLSSVLRYQRLINLITMYDKELIHQAKTYFMGHYDISMNHSQNSLDLTSHISNELSTLISDIKARYPNT